MVHCRRPNFSLHLHECGRITLADEAIECTDLDAARIAAIDAARDIMSSDVSEGRLCPSCHIEIEDDGGMIVMLVRFADAVTTVTGHDLPGESG